jgi:hypothetical protein
MGAEAHKVEPPMKAEPTKIEEPKPEHSIEHPFKVEAVKVKVVMAKVESKRPGPFKLKPAKS